MPAAAASGMIATQDVLHLLWKWSKRRFISGFLERHEPILGYVLVCKEIPSPMHSVTTEGFGVKRCWQIPGELGRAFTVSIWVRLPPEIREDVDVLRYVAQLCVQVSCGLGVVRHSAAATRERISISLRHTTTHCPDG